MPTVLTPHIQTPLTVPSNDSREKFLLGPQWTRDKRPLLLLLMSPPGPRLPHTVSWWFDQPSFSPLLFQIIRKVVRQVDSSGAIDTQQHEEVIVEGPLVDPGDLEADIESFRKLTKVLRSCRPPGGRSKLTSTAPLLCSGLHALLFGYLSGGQCPHLLLPVPFHHLPVFPRLPM